MIEGISPLEEKRPLFHSVWPIGQLAILIVLVFAGMILFSVIGILIAILFYHVNVIGNPGIFNDLTQPGVVPSLKVLQSVSVIGGFVIPAIFFGWFAGRNPIRYLKLNIAPRAVMVFLVMVTIVCVAPAINMIAELNSKMVLPEFLRGLEDWMRSSEDQAARMTEAFLKMDSVLDLFAGLFIIAFLAAFGEELLFRGCIQNLFRSSMKNKHTAIWVTAAVFSAFHMQFYGFLPRMLLGALLGYLYEWSGSLWLSIIAHFINNGVAVFFSYLLQKGTIATDPTSLGTQSSGMIPGIVSVILVTGLLFLIYRFRKVNPVPDLQD